MTPNLGFKVVVLLTPVYLILSNCRVQIVYLLNFQYSVLLMCSLHA